MKFDEKQSKNNDEKNTENWWKTMQKQWKTNEIWWKTMQKQWKIMKTDEKQCKNNEKPMKFDEKQCKNNEKIMKTDEKQCKNNEKIMKRFGSRTSTLARGLRPIHPGYYNGETKREHNGKKMEKRKMKKQIISINFNFI